MSSTSAGTRSKPEATTINATEHTTPAFVFSRPGHHLQATGVSAGFDSIAAARTALDNGDHDYIVGALPFDTDAPAALMAPAEVTHTAQRWQSQDTALPPVEIVTTVPTPEEHVRRVRVALDALTDPATALSKVVLARTLVLRASAPLDPLALLGRLVDADHAHNGFLTDLSPAGPAYDGHLLIGSSPEVLVRRTGSTVTCHPLAGSAPRSADPDVDREQARRLTASAKDQHEHAFVVEALAERLRPLCGDLIVPTTPSLTETPAMWHLGTEISGQIRDPSITALDLARILHPTPAVCGTPTAQSRDHILRTEEDRRFYAGAVGWCDATGNGEWLVSIRCAELDADRRTMRACAGGGIVADSDPDQELAETSAKFRTILTALGVG